MRGAWAEVDLGAFRHNVREQRRAIGDKVRLCAVVKANAYQHGAIPIATEAVRAGADYLAVATVSEGVELRRAGIVAPILLLGPSQPCEADEVAHFALTQATFTREQVDALSAAATRQGVAVKAHLAIDTGMSRIGVRPEDAADMAAAIAKAPGVELEGAFTHFATADQADQTFTREQYGRFTRALAAIKARGINVPIRHAANAPASLLVPECHLDMIRSGIVLMGVYPSRDVDYGVDLRPVLTLKARLSYVKDIRPGDTVSYGRTFTATKPMRIATLPIGYADGYSRRYSNRAKVELRGRLAPVVGRVCMDQCMIDVTDVPGAAVGDVATLYGAGQISLADVAYNWLDSIPHELFCLLNARVPRVYIDTGE